MRLAPIPAVLLAALFLWTSPAAAAQKPDLAIAAQDLAFSPAPPLAGTDLTVTVTVHNLGAVESKPALAAVKVARKAKKVFKTTAAVGAIPPGGAVQIPVVLGTYDEGTYTLIVRVDPANKVRESSEGNNKVLLPFAVATTNPFVGQAAAAAFGTMNSVSSAVLDAVARATDGVGGASVTRRNPSAETAKTCSKVGAFEYTLTPDFTRIRPGNLEAVSPAPGTDPCEEWVNQVGTAPDLGSYDRHIGRLSVDIGYQSDSPFDPGFIKPATLVLKTGDGVPGTANPLPDFVTESRLLIPDGSGGALDSLLLTQDSDYTATATVLGTGADGMPDHLRLALSGALVTTAGEAGPAVTATFDGFAIEATYTVSGDATEIITVADGTVTVTSAMDPSRNLAITCRDFTRIHRVLPSGAEVSVAGGVELASSCISGSFTFDTQEVLLYAEGSPCPTSGKIAVTSTAGSATLLFYSDGSMGVDDGADGTVDHLYPSCMDAVPLQCP